MGFRDAASGGATVAFAQRLLFLRTRTRT